MSLKDVLEHITLSLVTKHLRVWQPDSVPSVVPTGLVTFSKPAPQQKAFQVSQAFNLVQQTDLRLVETWSNLCMWSRWAERFAVSAVADPRQGLIVENELKCIRAGSEHCAQCFPLR